jgi:hypothetical protein
MKALCIAICFFGLTRSLKYTIQSIQNNIFKILQENHIDYETFIHTFQLHSINNPRSGEKDIALNTTEYKLLEPNFVKVTDQNSFIQNINLDDFLVHGDTWKDGNHSVKNLICQYQSISLVTDLWLERNKTRSFDLVLYLRPDLEYNRLNVSNLYYAYENHKIIVPSYHNYGGFNDRFAVGPSDIMQVYGKRIDILRDYCVKKRLHSETFMKDLLSPYEAEAVFQLIGKRIRANGKTNALDANLF